MKTLHILVLMLLTVNLLYAELRISVITDKTVYRYGDTLYVNIWAINNSNSPDTLFFGSCLSADYLFDSIDWAYGRAWCQHTSTSIVPSNDSISWGKGYFYGNPYLPGSPLQEIGKHSVVGKLWGYGLSDTVWITVVPLTGVRERADVPPDVRLEENFPNPFNPSTSIRYALPNKLHVTLTVFNTLGQQVATLVNEVQEAGYHEVRFDGSGLASGVYFYRLRAGDFVQSRKLVLLK